LPALITYPQISKLKYQNWIKLLLLILASRNS